MAEQKKCKKAGKNKSKCDRYRLRSLRERNGIRKAEALLRKFVKRGIRPKCQAALRAKIQKLERIMAGLPSKRAVAAG